MTEIKGDLISREWLKDAFDNLCCHNCKICRNFRNEDSFYKCNLIENAPTVERPHGEWIVQRNKQRAHIYSVCSKCNMPYLDTDFPNFCPNCGSDNRPKIHGCSFADEECKNNPCKDCGLKEG